MTPGEGIASRSQPGLVLSKRSQPARSIPGEEEKEAPARSDRTPGSDPTEWLS